MPLGSRTTQLRWQSQPLEDYLQLTTPNSGIVLGGINSTGNPYGSLANIAPGVLPPAAVTLSLTPLSPGNFTVAHGLISTPSAGLIMMTSGGSIYWQPARWDGTNVYLTATDMGVTADLLLWM